MRPQLGKGIGWRPEIAGLVAGAGDLGFVELIAELVPPGGAIPGPVLDLRARGVQVIPHGVKLSVGSAEPPPRERIEHLADLARRLDAPLVSEHIAFVRGGGLEAGHLLPVPRTRAALDVLCENVAIVQDGLSVPLALEHIAALVEWPDAELDEPGFLRELLERTGALLLLDVSNVYANARNHGFDAVGFIESLPLDRIAYVHVGGGMHGQDGLYHDTHSHPVLADVLVLVEELCARADPPGVMLERDDDYPPGDELLAELRAIDAAVARGGARRTPASA